MDKDLRELIKRDTLCSNNLQVKFYLTNIKKRMKKLGIIDSEISELITDSLETLRIMKKQGQNLEDRCRAYFQSVINLGFIRVKKDKKKS